MLRGVIKLIQNFFFLLFSFSMLLGAVPLNASAYDNDVLDIFSKLMPRIILMSSGKNSLQDKIEICVLHDKIDERVALSLTDKIDSNYPNGIKNYKIKLVNSNYSNIEACQNSQLAFMFDTGDKNIEKLIKFSNEHAIFTMSYDPKYLEKGVNASLFLGRKVTPYVNMNALRKNGIELDNVLVRISKIYSNEDGK